MRRRARSVAVGAALLVAWVLVGMGQFEIPTLPTSPGGTSSGESINFGDVAVGQTRSSQYTFKVLESSQTAARVTIYDPCAPFGLSGLTSRSMTLQPGQSVTFNVTFAPTEGKSYSCSFKIRAEGGYPVQVKETVVQLTGRGISSGGTEGESPGTGTSGPAFPFLVSPVEPLPTGDAKPVSGMTDEVGHFNVSLSPATTVSGTLRESEVGPLANQSFDLTETDERYTVVVPGFSAVTAPVASMVTFIGMKSVDLGVISLTRTEKKPVPCDCARLSSAEDCKKRAIQYYVEIPSDCEPISMHLVDKTSAAALWDKLIYSERGFASLSESSQRDVLANEGVVGVESNRVYLYQGQGRAGNTKITIVRREGDPKKWLVELSSCCHTIPTLQISLECPGSQTVRTMALGLAFDENSQYEVVGDVLVDFRKLTLENCKSFFEDCSLPYCDANDRSDPSSLKSNGRILLQMAPDISCKLDVSAFQKDLCETLAREGCHCEIPVMDARDGSLKGWIYTNRCTPQVAACVEEVLKRHTDCKEVQWIGRQISIRPAPGS